MGIGKISEDVFLRVLPPGITATVKSAKITYPEPKEGWYALWTHGNHSIKDTNDAAKMDEIFPYEVKAGKGYDGQIASLHISPEPLDHGATPKISWTIHFEGTTEAKSKDGTLKRIEVNKNCTITLSTTDWGWIARPDRVKVTWFVEGVAESQSMDNDIAKLVAVRGIEVVAAVDAESEAFAIHVSVESNAWLTAIEWAVEGILWGHEQALGWVFAPAKALVIASATGLISGAVKAM